MGYTSTSKSFERALNFASFELTDDDRVPVVFEIFFKGSIGLFELTSEHTAFPGEDEVLI